MAVSDKETWLPVVGSENFYDVSDLGRIRRNSPGKRTHVGKIVKGGIWNGYVCHTLSVGQGKKIHAKAHAIVLESFVGKRPIGFEANHKNGVRSDNRAENLEWVSRTANTVHSFSELGRKTKMARGSRNGFSKLTDKDVREIRILFPGIRGNTLAQIYGVTATTISRVVRNQLWTHVK